MTHDPDDEPTPPPQRVADVQSSPIIRLLEREVTDEDRALAKRIARVGGEPSLLAARLVRALEAREQTSSEQVAEQLGEALKAHDTRLDEVVGDVRDIKTSGRWVKAIAGTALAIAGAAGGAIASDMLSGKELKGEYRIRMEHLEERVDWLFDRITKDSR